MWSSGGCKTKWETVCSTIEVTRFTLVWKDCNALFGWIAGGGTVATIMSEIIAPSLSKAAHLGQISGRLFGSGRLRVDTPVSVLPIVLNHYVRTSPRLYI
jgi:hypothetical protein